MRISDWSSDVCSSDLCDHLLPRKSRLCPLCSKLSFRRCGGKVESFPEGYEGAAEGGSVGVDTIPTSRYVDSHDDDESPFLPIRRATRRRRTWPPGGGQDERRVGTEGVCTCRDRWSPD